MMVVTTYFTKPKKLMQNFTIFDCMKIEMKNTN